MKLYVLVKNCSADDYYWNEMYKAFYSKQEASQTLKHMESENGSKIWTEDYYFYYYTIKSVNVDSVKPVEDPHLIHGGWIGRETECCGYCGNNLRLTAKFCDRCGREVNREELTKKTLKIKL